ncbi:MAG: DNA-formamidopyrimidine glycosylase family protein [Bowdeniella nasicola]|nr:DNA-formamidopyrimidine glycosylase family protein [Bowdeniella nasicola]
MPEGHAIHRLALAFNELMVGHRLEVSSPQGRFADGARLLDGRRLTSTEAYGKHLLLWFDELALHVHLGLYGSWTFDGAPTFSAPHAIGAPRRRVAEEEHTVAPAAGDRSAGLGEGATQPRADGLGTETDESDAPAWQPPEPRGQVRVRLLTEHGVADLSGPNQCAIIDVSEAAALRARLGPDPLRRDADPERFIDAARATRRPIGLVVMDQSVLAGAGNIYRAECLFRVGINPHRASARTSRTRLRALWEDLSETMAEGVETGRIETVPAGYRTWRGEPTEERRFVYQRDGLACLRCGGSVVLEEAAKRKLYRCVACQR